MMFTLLRSLFRIEYRLLLQCAAYCIIIRQLMERYREQKKDLHMVFIDLEKAYDNTEKRHVVGLGEAKSPNYTLPSSRICTKM